MFCGVFRIFYKAVQKRIGGNLSIFFRHFRTKEERVKVVNQSQDQIQLVYNFKKSIRYFHQNLGIIRFEVNKKRKIS